jgi:hypothetical protein
MLIFKIYFHANEHGHGHGQTWRETLSWAQTPILTWTRTLTWMWTWTPGMPIHILKIGFQLFEIILQSAIASKDLSYIIEMYYLWLGWIEQNQEITSHIFKTINCFLVFKFILDILQRYCRKFSLFYFCMFIEQPSCKYFTGYW